MASCEDILSRNADAWKRAVTHPFLTAVQDGTISDNQFDAWLVQDGLFVLEFIRLHARALAAAPPAHFPLLLGAAAALKDELAWFQDLTRKRGLHADAAPAPACRAYAEFMEDTARQPYAVVAATLWAIERCYNEAWHAHMPGMPKPYHHYAERWGSMEFGAFVAGLARQADEALAAAPPEQRQEAERRFLRVCELEQDFWAMAYDATAFE